LEKSPFLEALGKFRFPWFFERKTDKHLIIQQSGPGRSGTPALVSFLSQVLASFDAARVRLLMVDPIELGASFSAFSAFGDGNKDLITRDTWVTKEDIRRELIALVEHIKTTLTGILRDKSDDLDTYNATPNVIVKPYTFVAIAGFPENFDQECCTFLERILANGPRCGVHVLMTWDRSRPLPHGVTDDSLLRQGILAQVDSTGAIKGIRDAKTNLMKPRFDSRPNAIALTDVVKAASAQAEKNGRVEGRFQVASATVDLKAASSSAMASAGVLHPRVFLGRLFIRAATSFSQVWLASLRSVPLGMNWRRRPLVFSLLPRCQGA